MGAIRSGGKRFVEAGIGQFEAAVGGGADVTRA
jgi:hypothetical protein